MTANGKLILRIIVLWGVGAVGLHQLTLWSAPAHDEAAVFVGVLLTSFGVVAAQFAMNLVVLPIAVLRMFKRVLTGRKPMVLDAHGRDALDTFGRVVFVAGFTVLSALVGAFAGMAAGGLGFFAAAAAFGAFGGVWAMLIPTEVVFATLEDTGGTITDEQRADHAAARQAGEPTVLFADRVVKNLRDSLFEDPRKP